MNVSPDFGGALWRGQRDSDEDPGEAAQKIHCHALSPVYPNKTRPLRWQTHSTRHCHKVSASSPHRPFPRHPRSPATCARFPTTPARKPPRLAQARRPRNEVAYPHLVAVRRTYLRRERPPLCVCAIRIAQIRRCTHTSLVRPPCVISTGHLFQATPLKNQRAKCEKRLLLMCTRRWMRTASFSYVAPTEHWRVTTAVPRSSQASRPPSGQARRCASVSGIHLFVPETDRGQCAHTPSSDLSPFEPRHARTIHLF